MDKYNLTITCDSSALDTVIQIITKRSKLLSEESLKSLEKVIHRLLYLGHFSFELTRINSGNSTAGASELTVFLYPTNRLLVLTRTLLAGNGDFSIFEHDNSPLLTEYIEQSVSSEEFLSLQEVKP